MEILKIEPRWNHEWANSPDIEIWLDKSTSDLEWIYRPVPDHALRETMLISTNNAPWVRFVYIDDPDGAPNLHGALGGDYQLEDGSVLKSRSGWSSRAGQINKSYREFVDDELVEVFVTYPPYSERAIQQGRRPMFMTGNAIYATALKNHPLFPKDCHLVREILFRNKEPYWHISSQPDKVVKP